MIYRTRRPAVILMMIVAVSLLAVSLDFPAQAQTAGGQPVHALTLEADAAGDVTVQGYTQTALRRPLVSDSPTRLAEAAQAIQDPEYDIAIVQLMTEGNTVGMDDATGAIVFQTTVTIPRWIRSEHAIDPNDLSVTGPNGSNIDGRRLPLDRKTFAVKVPVITGANRLSVQIAGSERSSGIIDLTAVAQVFGAQRDPRDPAVLLPGVGFSNGDPANRVDVVIVGDGYTAAQQALFAADAQTLIDGMFAISPYSTYQKYFNVVAVFGDSIESGVDRPDCDPIFKNTRYDTTFCYNGIDRLMVPQNTSAIFSDVNSLTGYPDWDEIILIANDTTYGGSGGAIASVSTNPFAIDVLQHEVGHSLMRLDDEYDTFTPGYPPCSDFGRDGITTLCRPNVTDQTSRSLIKWARWIAPSTPVPTSGDLGPEAGLWLGAHYQPTVYYRGCFNCIMRSLGRPFGTVAAEQLPVVLYQGGWEGQGSYWEGLNNGSGIDIVEPDGTSPDPAATVGIASGASQTFSVKVLSPAGGSFARVKWKIDGALVQDSTAAYRDDVSFTFTPIVSGPYTVTAEVTDVGGILHSSQTGISKTTVAWTVNAEGSAAVGTELVANGGFETPDPLDPKLADGWAEKNLDKGKRKCDKPDKIVASEGSCAYLFKGVDGVNGKLKQVIPAPVGDAGDVFALRADFDTLNLTAKFFAKAKFVYADGSSASVKLENLPGDSSKTQPYFLRDAGLILGLDAVNVTAIKVQIKLAGSGGKVYADSVSLMHYDEYLTSPPRDNRSGDVLPVPLAPPDFRGQN